MYVYVDVLFINLFVIAKENNDHHKNQTIIISNFRKTIRINVIIIYTKSFMLIRKKKKKYPQTKNGINATSCNQRHFKAGKC